MTEAEKQARRELKMREEEQRRAEEQARHEKEVKETAQRRVEARKSELISNRRFRKMMIGQLSDPLLAREVQLRYEAELKEFGLESLEEDTSVNDQIISGPDAGGGPVIL